MFFKMMVLVTLLTLLLGLVENIEFVPKQKYDTSLQVKIKNGILQGRINKTPEGTTYMAYQGIPYAKPPIDDLRFKSPKPPSDWNDVLDATQDPPTCAQVRVRLSIEFRGQEDCLYLNVYRPLTQTEKLPIMVWIYGGAFQDGNSNYSEYSPDHLLDHGVIVITLNFRVGVFGFLSTGDLACPGNFGLKDQSAALKWINGNIEYFGGDPSRVTLFGESSGAASAMYHMFSPMSKGLVHGIILESGCTLAPWSYQKEPRRVAFDIGLTLDIKTTSSKRLMYKLRRYTTSEILTASTLPLLMSYVQIMTHGLPFTPTTEPTHEEAFITNLTYDLLEKGEFEKVPLLAGVNSLEAAFLEPFVPILQPALFLYDVSPGSLLRMNIPSSADKTYVANKIKKYFFKSGSFVGATKDEIFQFFSADFYRRPLQKSVSMLYEHIPIYLYVFSYQGPPGLIGLKDFIRNGRNFNGTAHSEEISYLIPNNKTMQMMTSKDNLVLHKMTKFWSNFAKSGNPTPRKDQDFGNIIWPRVKTFKNIPYLEIGENISLRQNFYEESFLLWDKLYEKYAKRPYFWY